MTLFWTNWPWKLKKLAALHTGRFLHQMEVVCKTVSDTLIFYNIKCILFLGKCGLLVPSFPNTLPVGYRFGKASMKILEGIYMESFFFIFFFLSFMTSAARMAHFHIKTLRDSSWLWDYSCASVEQQCSKRPKSGTMLRRQIINVGSKKRNCSENKGVRWRHSE